jgi:hypothetical protein
MNQKVASEADQAADFVNSTPTVEAPGSMNSSASDDIGRIEAGAEKPGVQEAEWTMQSSLQVLGGFMVLFNSYD